MFISPLQNTFNRPPVVTQGFGHTSFSSSGIYGYYNGKPRPHNGIDLRTRGEKRLYAPMDGVVQVRQDPNGYGLHIVIRSELKGWEIKLAHLSSTYVKTGDIISCGDLIGKTGTSGNSTAHHLHFSTRRLVKDNSKDLWDWSIVDYDREYYGYVDPLKLTLSWGGTLSSDDFSYLSSSTFNNIINRKK